MGHESGEGIYGNPARAKVQFLPRIFLFGDSRCHQHAKGSIFAGLDSIYGCNHLHILEVGNQPFAAEVGLDYRCSQERSISPRHHNRPPSKWSQSSWTCGVCCPINLLRYPHALGCLGLGKIVSISKMIVVRGVSLPSAREPDTHTESVAAPPWFPSSAAAPS